MLDSLFGAEMPLAIRLCLAFLIVLVLISAAAWAFPRIGRGRLAVARGHQARLSIIDSASIKGSRHLILIRRDNVEHVLMIGGSTDVVVDTGILQGAGAPLELPVRRSPTAPDRQSRAITQPDIGSRPLLPERAAIPRPAPQITPPAPPFRPLSQELAAKQSQAQAEPPTRLQRDTLAALAIQLSTRAPAPPKDSATVAQPHPVEPRPELRSEPGLELRSDPGIKPRSAPSAENGPEYRVEIQPETPQPAQPMPAQTVPTADEELAELARLLEAKLRNPNVLAAARPSAAPASIAPPQRAPAGEAVPAPPSPQQAPAAEAVPPPPPPLVRARIPSEPARVDAKPEQSTTPGDSLEQQLANLLGRSTKN
jgi:flagellar protein FliO/FliZ